MSSASIGVTAFSAAEPRTESRRMALGWFLIAVAGYWLAAHHQPIVQKHYVYLADAFLHGSLSVADPPSGLVEIIPANGGNYVAYGIMPAIVLLPLVAIWGAALDPALVLIVMGAINVVLMYLVLRRLELPQSVIHWMTALFAFGTVHFLASVWGTTWFFMQVTAVSFLLLAIHEGLGPQRGWLVGLWLGAAMLSRNAVLLAAPFFLLMLNSRRSGGTKTAQFVASLTISVAVLGAYNFARFGSFADTGYGRIFSQPYGMFSGYYLKSNVLTYFFALPERLSEFPYFRPNLHGLSLFLTTPAFLLTLRAVPRNLLTLATWMPVAAIGSLYLLYFWDGFAQFGMRYTLDFTPFLIMLTALACGAGMKVPAKALIVASIVVQLWGVAWWRFGGLTGM